MSYYPTGTTASEGKHPVIRVNLDKLNNMKISAGFDLISQYLRAELYAITSIKRFTDFHLLWGPVYARCALGIGARNFSLYSLAGVPRKTWSDYLANEPLKVRYAAVTSKEARVVADDKIRFYEHCHRHGISTPKILALITPLKSEGSLIPHVYSAQSVAEVLVPGEYFIKPSNGSHGEGTFSLAVDATELRWAGHRGSYDDFFSYCLSALKHTKSLIVQPKLVNHRAIRDITHARGLSTIRVVTVRKSGAIKVIAACLRIVVGDSEIDSFSHGSSGNLLGAIDVERGELTTARGSRSRTWPQMIDVMKHPDSGMSVVGASLPYWSQVLDLVKEAHDSIENLHTVGWDVAVLDDGPVIVEANWRYDIDLLQVAYRKGFRQVLAENLAH